MIESGAAHDVCNLDYGRYFANIEWRSGSLMRHQEQMNSNERCSPWLASYIGHLFNQDFGEDTRRIVGDDFEEFRHGYVVASLELGIAKSLFLSTWEEIATIYAFKSLADRTAEIRNFIAHGIEVVHRGPPPYARLVNARHYSQPYSVEFGRDASGVLGPKSKGDHDDLQKLINLNRSRNVYRFVQNDFAKWFVQTYAPSQLDENNALSGLTSEEIFRMQQGLIVERKNIGEKRTS